MMYIKVKVTPESKRDILQRIHEESFKISVTDKANHNLANKKTLELLARHLAVPTKNLRIITGHRKPQKIIYVKR